LPAATSKAQESQRAPNPIPSNRAPKSP